MQNKLKGELVRVTTSDNLELQGILYKPQNSTDKVIVHIHGWTGNFYENVFIEYIAKACVSNGYAFLSFNTRGAGFVQEFLRKKGSKVEYVKIGGSLEKFEDCLFDIKAAISFLKTEGFREFILEGHSTGCQKALFYKHKTKDSRIKGLILLEPADDPSIVKRILTERYEEAMEYAKNLVNAGKPEVSMPEWVDFGVNLAARKFLSIADPNSVEGKLLHLPGELEELNNLNLPILVISADNSEYQDAKSMQKKIEGIAKKFTGNVISNAGHWFLDMKKKWVKIISNWIEKTQR